LLQLVEVFLALGLLLRLGLQVWRFAGLLLVAVLLGLKLFVL
jgi:hypothetical protein